MELEENDPLKKESKELYFKGAPISQGIGIGVPVFLSEVEDQRTSEFPISLGEVDEEIARYREAISSSKEDLKKLQAECGSLDEVSSIIDAHIQMLDDPVITAQVEEKIREQLKSTEEVFKVVMRDYEKRFAEMSDAFFQERAFDVRDLSKRVLKKLQVEEERWTAEMPQNAIIVAKELVPSETASMEGGFVGAFVTESGGGTSHAALIAKAKGIPYVASIGIEVLRKAQGRCVIVDGLTGDIIVNPSEDTLEKYQSLKERLTTHYSSSADLDRLPASTRDGVRIEVHANVGTFSDLEMGLHHGAEGVGLVRSEFFLFSDREALFDEEKQYQFYRNLKEKSGGLPLVIRLLDLGGDKTSDFFPETLKESNPALGCRGIRFLMKQKELFRVQLRALYRVGGIKILIPFISDIGELRQVKAFMREVQGDLDPLPIGIMLEIPSAVLSANHLAKEVDFFALGTNDLAQYTLGVDRSNIGLLEAYSPVHPSVLSMIQIAVKKAKERGIPLEVCGEIASNPDYVPLLIGLGVTAISCFPSAIPMIKKTIRETSSLEAESLAQKALSLETAAEIIAHL